MRRGWLGLALLLVAAGCAQTVRVAPPTHDEMVVLLPGADGKTGALVVTHAGQQQTLDNAYATARVKDPGEIERGQTDATAVREAFAPALSAQPPRPGPRAPACSTFRWWGRSQCNVAAGRREPKNGAPR